MAEPYPPSPVPADADPWPGERPFTAFGQFGPDHLDLRVFEQDAYWVDYFGRPHLLEEMPEDYRRNVLAFLVERAERFHLDSCLRSVIQQVGDALLGRPNGERLLESAGGPGLLSLEPRAWLEATPLVRRLRALTPD